MEPKIEEQTPTLSSPPTTDLFWDSQKILEQGGLSTVDIYDEEDNLFYTGEWIFEVKPGKEPQIPSGVYRIIEGVFYKVA